MSLSVGTKLPGSIDSVEAMRLRCYCDGETGCWHLRTARGRPQGDSQRNVTVWVHGRGKQNAARAMWELRMGEILPQHLVVFRKCDSRDCVNPEHLRVGSKAFEVRNSAKRGRFKTSACAKARRENGESRAIVTAELRVWLVESSQEAIDAAHGLGISTGHAYLLRRKERSRLPTATASIFAFGRAMGGAHPWRAAA